jgi:hypothetical protein
VRGEVHDAQVEPARRVHDLCRLLVVQDVTGPEDFVPVDDPLPRPPHRLGVQRAGQAQRPRHQVGGAGGCELVQQPHLLLADRQRQLRAVAVRPADPALGSRRGLEPLLDQCFR